MKSNVLIVVAHLDDEVFGMGGTLNQLCSKYNVKVLTFCKGRNDKNSQDRLSAHHQVMNELGFTSVVLSHYDMELDTLHMKDITKVIEEVVDEFCPFMVFTNCSDDIHQDHVIVSTATKIAVRPSRSKVQSLYEIQISDSQPYEHTYFDCVNDTSDVYTTTQRLFRLYSSENTPIVETTERFKTIFTNLNI